MSLKNPVMLLTAWLLTAITTTKAGAEELKWQEHINENGNFRITMPGELVYLGTPDVDSEHSDDKRMSTCHAIYKSGEFAASFMAQSIRHSPKFLAKYTPAERINHLLDRTILDFHKKSPDVKFEVHREPRVTQGYSGEYLRITLPGPELWEAHTLVFYAGDIHYSAEVIIASKDSKRVLSQSDIEKFLSSFSLLAKTFEFNGTVTSISSTRDGRTVVLGSRGGLASLWDSQTGMPLRNYEIAKGHWDGESENYPELEVAISPDGKQFITGSAQGIVTLWDVATGKEVRNFRRESPEVRTVAFSLDGRLGAARFRDDSVSVWVCSSGKQIAHFKVDSHSIESFAISPDGRRLAVRLDDRSKEVENNFQIYDVPSGRLLSEIKVPYPHDAAFSPDGEILATASGKDVRVWNTETGQELRRLDKFRLAGDADRIAFSNDGKLIAAFGTTYDQATVRVWNLRDNRVNDEFHRSRSSSENITSISFTPDNQWVLVTGFGGERGFVNPFRLGVAKPGSFDSKPPGLQADDAGAAGEGERQGRLRRRGGEAWADLIDSNSFPQWTNTGKRDVFKLGPDGSLRGSGGRSYLVSPRAYDDFELTGRMKVSREGNGGIFFGVPAGSDMNPPLGYEVQLYIRKSVEGPGTGGLFLDGIQMRRGTYSTYSGHRFDVPDRWYSFRIRHQGSSLLVKIDDREVHNLDDAEHRAGHIALQCYSDSGEVHYADLKIRDLSPGSPGVDTAAAGADAKLAVAKGVPEPGSAMRRWTDHTGKHTVQAKYLGSDKQNVTVQLENGKKLTVQIDQLSESDQQFVRDAIAASKAPKPAVGKATTPAASIVSDTPAAEENRVAAKAPLALCDITIGMTDREVARVFERKGLRVTKDMVNYENSAMNKFAGARQQQFVEEVAFYRFETGFQVRTYITVEFMEDLPDRPGVGVCTSVKYKKEFHPNSGDLNVEPLAQRAIDDLIARHGPFNNEGEDYVRFGDAKGSFLLACRKYLDIELRDVALEKRLRDAEDKVEKIDARPVLTNAGPTDY